MPRREHLWQMARLEDRPQPLGMQNNPEPALLDDVKNRDQQQQPAFERRPKDPVRHHIPNQQSLSLAAVAR